MHVVQKDGIEGETIHMFPELPKIAFVPATGVVDWFDPTLGHGLVKLEDGRRAMLELSSLAWLHMLNIPKSTKITGMLDMRNPEKLRFCKIRSADWSHAREYPQTDPQDGSNAQYHSGTVKWFNQARGYGFIALDNDHGDGDVFIHLKTCLKCSVPEVLKDGMRVFVQFIKNDAGKLAATEIKLAK